MGVCTSHTGKVEDGEQFSRRKMASSLAETKQKAIMDSELYRLHTACGLKIDAHALETPRMVLETAAEQLELPKAAAVFLRMRFAGADVPHNQAMQDAGLRDGAQFELLNKQKAEAKVQEANQCGDLLIAAQEGRVEGVEAYCTLYPDKVNDITNQYGMTPLHKAAGYNSVNVAELLLAAGASVNVQSNNQNTPLHQAARNNALEMAELLLAAGASLDVKNSLGETPLDVACGVTCGAMVELFEAH